MKVMQRMIMTLFPGKMEEAKKLLGEYMALINKKYGPFPAMRMYTPWLGGGNTMRTLIGEIDWESFEKMAAFFEKAMADPGMQALMPQWQAVEESHRNELYTLTPLP